MTLRDDIMTFLSNEKLLPNEFEAELQAVPDSLFYTKLKNECMPFKGREAEGYRHFYKLLCLQDTRGYTIPKLNKDQIKQILVFMIRINE